MSTFRKYIFKEKGETIMLFAVLSQSFWALLQTMLVDVYNYNEDVASKIRVMFVVVTMGYAITYGLFKAQKKFVIIYGAAFLLLLLTLVVFPENQDYLTSEAFKLTLPVVLPSFLCLTCVRDIDKIENILCVVSWMSFIIGIVYAVSLFTGKYAFSEYSMSLSFSLLLPTLVLMTRNYVLAKLASVFLFILIVFLGSRSAAIVIVVYLMIDTLFRKKKYIIPVVALVVLAFVFMNAVTSLFEHYGVVSRTLTILESDNGLLAHMSHRDEIYDMCISKIEENPILGIGLYGDRLFLHGSTSHNVVLEILLNFGVFIGGGIIITLMFYFFKTYFYASRDRKVFFLRYFCAVIIPLMVSGSYLKDYNLGLFLGICYLINKESANYIYILKHKIRIHG